MLFPIDYFRPMKLLSLGRRDPIVDSGSNNKTALKNVAVPRESMGTVIMISALWCLMPITCLMAYLWAPKAFLPGTLGLLFATLPSAVAIWNLAWLIRGWRSPDRMFRFVADDRGLRQDLLIRGQFYASVRRMKWDDIEFVTNSENGVLIAPKKGSSFLIPNQCFETPAQKAALLGRVERLASLSPGQVGR